MLKKYSTVIQIIILIMLIYWAYKINFDNQLANEKIYSTATIKNVTMRSYNTAGYLQHILFANNIYYDGRTKISLYDYPKLLTYDPLSGKQKQWEITSNKAKLLHENLLLKGNVIARNLEKNSSIKKILIQSLNINLKTKDYSSSDHVSIYGKNFINSGYGVSGNLHSKTVSIHNNVKGIFNNAS